MGVDLGSVRTGISLCDANETLAYPLCVIKESDLNILSHRVYDICKEQKVAKIVIGYPKNMNGTIGQSAKRSEEFKSLIPSDIKTILWDERLTTVYSQKNFLNLNINSRKQKKRNIIDSSASTFLLQDYLNYKAHEELRKQAKIKNLNNMQQTK